MIMWLAMLIPPPPPPPAQRTTALPQYAATCVVVGRDARDHRLAVAVTGSGPSRRATFRSGSGPLAQLTAGDQKLTTMSTGNPRTRWETADVVKARLGTQEVDVWLEVGPDLSAGATIRIENPADWIGVSLFSGMCRTSPIEASSPR